MAFSRYRALTEEFRNHMDRRGGWPRGEVVRPWFKEFWGGIAGNAYTDMRRGSFVPEKYPLGFVTMLADRGEAPSLRQARVVLLDFLIPFDIHEVTRQAAEAIVGHICGPIVYDPPRRSPPADYLMRGFAAMGELQTGHAIDRHVRACPQECLDEAVEWLCLRVAQCAAPRGPRLPREQALAAAAERMTVGLADYARRAHAWLRFNPWTVVRAWDGREAAGMTIVLPVKTEAYEAVRSGARPSFACGPEDLAVPSSDLIIEGAAERPDLQPSDPDANPTKALLVCLAIQVAALSRCHRLKRDAALRVLSFAGTPKNRDRLLSSGFKLTGTRMAEIGLEIVERTIRMGSLGPEALLHLSVLRYLSRFSPPAPANEIATIVAE